MIEVVDSDVLIEETKLKEEAKKGDEELKLVDFIEYFIFNKNVT